MTKPLNIEIGYKTFIRFCLVVVGFGLVGMLLFKAATALLIIGAALFLAIAISPLVNKISDLIPSKGRTLSITLAYVLVVGFLAGIVAIVGPTIINESVKFASNLPQLISDNIGEGTPIDNFAKSVGIEDTQAQIVSTLSTFTGGIVDNLSNFLAASIGTIANLVTAIILILVLSLFMLTEGPGILNRFWRRFRTSPEAKRASKVAERMADVVAKYVTNAISVSLINACCTAIAVFLLSVIFGLTPGLALPFGLITGIFSLIPMFGSLIGGCLVALLLAFNSVPAGISFLIYTIIYLQVESNFISPKIQSKGLKLPALVVLSAVTIGVYMFGLVGAIVAIPIAGCIKVLLEEYGDNLPFNDDPKTSPEPEPKVQKIIAEK